MLVKRPSSLLCSIWSAAWASRFCTVDSASFSRLRWRFSSSSTVGAFRYTYIASTPSRAYSVLHPWTSIDITHSRPVAATSRTVERLVPYRYFPGIPLECFWIQAVSRNRPSSISSCIFSSVAKLKVSPSTSCSSGGRVVWLTVRPNASPYSLRMRSMMSSVPTASGPTRMSIRGGGRSEAARSFRHALTT